LRFARAAANVGARGDEPARARFVPSVFLFFFYWFVAGFFL